MDATRNVWTLALGILFLLVVVVGGGLGSCAAYNSMRVIYVPTEAGLPILEAGMRGDDRQ